MLTAWQGRKSRLPTQHWLARVIVKLGAGGRGLQFLFCSLEYSSYLLKCLSCQAAPFLLWLEEAGSGLFLCASGHFQLVGFTSRSGIHEAKGKPRKHFCVLPWVPGPPASRAPFRLSESYICAIYNVQGFYLYFAGEVKPSTVYCIFHLHDCWLTLHCTDLGFLSRGNSCRQSSTELLIGVKQQLR